MTRKGNLFIISGPSGAGKGTLVKEILRRVPDIWLSVSATTRPARPGEVEGESYFFVSSEEFDRLSATSGLLEWAEVHGNRYGTPREAVERAIADGRQVVLEIDPQGALQVKDLMPDSVLVFIGAPSLEELRARIRARGAESEEQIQTRMRTAERELSLVGKYDHVVINDDVARASDELAAIIERYASAEV